jgi:adenylate cyclase
MEGTRRKRLAGAGERLAARWRRRQRAKAVLLVAAALATTGLALLLYFTDSLRRLDLDSVDARFSIRGEKTPPRDLLIVAIDAETFDELNHNWPFPRTFHARILRNLDRAGARVIAYDVQFTEASEDPAADEALYEALGPARPVVLSTTEVLVSGDTTVFGGREFLDPQGAVAANGLLPPDPNGVLRRLPYTVDGLKTFGVATVEAERGRPPPRPPRGKTAWIDYHGQPGTFPMVSYWRVYRNRFPANLVRGKTVIVGPTAPTLQDVHPTSIGGGNMPGAEIQANAIATARQGFPLVSAAEGWNVLAIVLLSLVVPLASLRFAPLRVALAAVLLGVAYAVVAQLVFNEGTVLTVVYPLLGLAVGEVASLAVVYFTETRERRRLKTIFARFVPETVVDQVIEQTEGDLRLGAVRLQSTVLFCDLRGFTSFAESLGEEIIDVLNHYLTEMSSAILDHGGTLVAYMGDGIMAVFGAPLEQPDHADRAVAAAKEMLGERLPRFNAWLAENGMPSGFRMGIGLNTGQVMSGNVGSERRMEYTAVGDTTNTASRIEGMTKGTPHQLFISDATKQLLREEADGLIEYGDVPVRGRQETIKLWALADEPEGGVADGAEPAATGATVT